MTHRTMSDMTVDTAPTDRPTDDEQLARRLIDHVNRRDHDAAAALLSPHYRVTWPDGEFDLDGSVGREITMMTGLPDTRFDIDGTTATVDGRVLVEATVRATHTGVLELPQGVVLEPTGRSVALPFVFLMRFVDGLLEHERLLFDHHELIHQLRPAG